MLHNNTSPAIQQASDNAWLEQLLPEMKQAVVAHLPIANIANLARVSQVWCSFVTQTLDYKKLITRDFAIPRETLLRFVLYAEYIDPSLPISFAAIYRSLYLLSKYVSEKKYKRFYSLPTSHLTLLACCVNHPAAQALLEKMISHEEAQDWLEISIQMHANHSACYLINRFSPLLFYPPVHIAIEVGNTQMALYLLERQPTLCRDDLLMAAVRYNNVKLAFHFLEHFQRNFPRDGYPSGISWCYQLLVMAAHSGNIAMFCQLLKYCQEKYNFDINEMNSRILEMAILYAHKEMVTYLVEKFPLLIQNLDMIHGACSLEFSIDTIALCYALKPSCFNQAEISSGLSDIFIYWVLANLEKFPLVDEKIKFNVTPTVDHLAHVMAEVKISPQLIRYIIDHYKLVPNRKIFHLSAQDEGLFRYFLEEYKFIPDSKTLAWLIRYNQTQLFDELRQRYALQPDSRALTMAVIADKVKTVSRLINEFGLRPNPDDFMRLSLPAITRLLLEAALGESAIPIDRKLYNSHEQIYRGIALYHEGKLDEAEDFWLRAAKDSLRHFFTFATLALSNPVRYNLDERCKPLLLSVAQQVVSMSISIPEQEAIYPMLLSCDNPALQALAEYFAPPLLCGIDQNPYAVSSPFKI